MTRTATNIFRTLLADELHELAAAYRRMPRSAYYLTTNGRTGKPRKISHEDAVSILAACGLVAA